MFVLFVFLICSLRVSNSFVLTSCNEPVLGLNDEPACRNLYCLHGDVAYVKIRKKGGTK